MKFTLFLQFFGGRGSSSSSGGGGAAGAANAGSQNNPNAQANQTATTPSGVTYAQFMQMSDAQKYSTMDQIINDPNIKVPPYLDGSVTSKVIYALGMNNKTTVVDDATLDSMQGREIYRTVYEQGTMPPPSSADVLDQIRNGDYTQLSDSGGSAHGRAIYFATDFGASASYGTYERNAMVMRAKINPSANIRSQGSLQGQMMSDTVWNNSAIARQARSNSRMSRDSMALYAISHGIDGWYSNNYTMMVNRGALTASSLNKRISGTNRQMSQSHVSTWQQAANAK